MILLFDANTNISISEYQIYYSCLIKSNTNEDRIYYADIVNMTLFKKNADIVNMTLFKKKMLI